MALNHISRLSTQVPFGSNRSCFSKIWKNLAVCAQFSQSSTLLVVCILTSGFVKGMYWASERCYCCLKPGKTDVFWPSGRGRFSLLGLLPPIYKCFSR